MGLRTEIQCGERERISFTQGHACHPASQRSTRGTISVRYEPVLNSVQPHEALKRQRVFHLAVQM